MYLEKIKHLEPSTAQRCISYVDDNNVPCVAKVPENLVKNDRWDYYFNNCLVNIEKQSVDVWHVKAVFVGFCSYVTFALKPCELLRFHEQLRSCEDSLDLNNVFSDYLLRDDA